MQTPRIDTHLCLQLDREWHRWLERPGSHRLPRSWQSGDPALDARVRPHLTAIRSLDEVVALTARHRGRPADEVVHWLLVVGREHELARRIVLQRTLAPTLAAATPWSATLGPAAFDDAIAASWIAIGRWDREDVCDHIVPRLVNSAIHEAFRRGHRRRSTTSDAHTSPYEFDRLLAAETDRDGLVALADLVALAERTGVEPPITELIRDLARGDSTATIARRRRCTDRSIRNHRRRAIERFRRLVDDLGLDPTDHATFAAALGRG